MFPLLSEVCRLRQEGRGVTLQLLLKSEFNLQALAV